MHGWSENLPDFGLGNLATLASDKRQVFNKRRRFWSIVRNNLRYVDLTSDPIHSQARIQDFLTEGLTAGESLPFPPLPPFPSPSLLPPSPFPSLPPPSLPLEVGPFKSS